MSSSASNLIHKLHQSVATKLIPYRTLLLAYSGGLDSTVLLDILTELRKVTSSYFVFRAIHIHHGLSKYADYWADNCTRECQKRNIIFNIIHVIVDKKTKSIEAAARNARYQALAKELIRNEVLLTAQHQNDQIETLLLALKRGSGPTGLASMSSDTSFYDHHRLVRPLLNCKRILLENYACERQLNWIEDDSNKKLCFERNFLRSCVLPTLCHRWPQFIDTVARSAQLCAEQEILLDELLKGTLASLIHSDGSLKLLAMKTMSSIKREALLRRWLASYKVRMPSRQQLLYIWHSIAISRRDAVAQLQIDNWQIRRFQQRLYVLPIYSTIIDNERKISWPIDKIYFKLPAKLGILFKQIYNNAYETSEDFQLKKENDNKLVKNNYALNKYNIYSNYMTIVRAPLSNEQVSVRFGSVSGLLYIIGRCRGRKLKKLWQELNIPPWQRSITPLLFYNDTLIAALGTFITREGKVNNKYTKWQLFWYRGI